MKKVYVVINNAAVDFEEVTELWGAFTNLAEAKKVMREKWLETTEEQFGKFFAVKDEYVVDDDGEGAIALSCYLDRNYIACHNTAHIIETTLK